MVKRGGVRGNFSSIKKAQASVEIIIILAFVMIIIIALVAINYDLMDSFGGQLNANKAKIVLDDLGDAAQQVYQQGVGAQARVFVSIPNNVNNTLVSDQTLRMTLGGSNNRRDVYNNLDFQVAGNIPTEEGNYWITVKSRQGYVIINYAVIDVSPGGFSRTLTPGNSTIETLSLDSTLPELVDVAISYSGDAEINVILSEYNFILSSYEEKDLLVTLSAHQNSSAGVYSGVIQVDANTTTESQTTFIPITITIDISSGGGSGSSFLLFPATWNLGVIAEDNLLSNQFQICNDLVSSLSVDLSFSDNSYVGFDSSIVSKTKSISVAGQACNTTDVYVNTSGATTGPYLTYLTADAGSDSDTSTIMLTIGVDNLPPTINLISPNESHMSLLGNIIFSYNTSDFASDIASCKLIINDSVQDTDSSIQEDFEQSFSVIGLQNGYYAWSINCTDTAPAANEGSSAKRDLIINFTTVYATPTQAFEEDYDPTWTTEVQSIGGGYAAAYDEGPPEHSNFPPPDYVEFDFPNLGISNDYGIDTVIFTFRHYEDLVNGFFDQDARHQIECYNGVSWVTIEVWPEDNVTWTNYTSPDLSSCISSASVANDIHIRVEFDPADDTGAVQYIDWAQVEVNISTAYYPDLWELIVDEPQPLDFSSGLNTTNNTFGRTAGDDGWDWQEDPYGGGESATEFNIDPNMDGNTADSTVAADNRLEIRLGDDAPGGQDNADDDSYNGPAASGAYGVAFNITPELYSKVSSGKAQLTFDWFADEDAGWGNGLDSGDEAWIKARLITPSTTIWLGSDLDSGDNDEDPYNEIWFMDNPEDASGHESIDITSYITSEGIYYIDFGIAVGDWDNNEGFGGYFDNIMIVIIG